MTGCLPKLCATRSQQASSHFPETCGLITTTKNNDDDDDDDDNDDDDTINFDDNLDVHLWQ